MMFVSQGRRQRAVDGGSHCTGLSRPSQYIFLTDHVDGKLIYAPSRMLLIIVERIDSCRLRDKLKSVAIFS